MNAQNSPESTALAVADRQQFDLSPRNFEQALTFSDYLAESDLVPKDFKGKPGNCLIAIQWGAEIGLKPLQALSNIAVINGRAALWGDAVIALVRSSALCEYVIETQTDTVATCKVKRRGEPEQERTFSMADAKAAGLQGKQGPWSQYPKRMMQMRARAFALRDVFPDVLRGLPVAEEIMDAPTERFMGPANEVKPPADAPTTYPAADFQKNLPAWRKLMAAGKKSADQIVAMVSSKATLTPEQIAEIRKEPEPVTDAPVKVSYATVASALHGAKDSDALATAADLIGEVSDPEQRRDLQAIYDKRETELKDQP